MSAERTYGRRGNVALLRRRSPSGALVATAYAHLHEGADVFAGTGTPLVAAERGVLRVGVAVLGGNRLWLVGASGTRYFYAHLSALRPRRGRRRGSGGRGGGRLRGQHGQRPEHP